MNNRMARRSLVIGLWSLFAAVLAAFSASSVMADENPAVNIRLVDRQLQMGTDSVRPYYIEWAPPAGKWQTWTTNTAIPAGLSGIWLRGIFQPDEVTSWEIPEDAEQFYAASREADVGDGALCWNTVAEQDAEGNLRGVPQATFEAALAGDGISTDDPIPAGISARANLIWYNPSSRTVAEWILNTSGVTQSTFAVSNAPSGYVPAGMGDVEGDGISDIILYNTNLNKVMVWFLNSEGRYRTNLMVNGGVSMSAGWMLRAIGDIDTDGRVDLIWHSSVSRKVAYWILNVDGTLMTYGFCTNMPMSAGWSLDASGDINGDSTVDLLWYNSSTRRVAYWLLNPDGTLNTSGFCTTNTMASGWLMRGAGDIKGDGTIGILWHNANTKQVAYWFLNSNAQLAGSGLCFGGTMSGGWVLEETPDINGDGRIDVVWFNTSTRKPAYWLLTTNGTIASSGYCTASTVASGYNLYGAGVCEPNYDNMWIETAQLPVGVYDAGADTLGSYIYHVGGMIGIDATNVYRFNGTAWTAVNGLPAGRSCHGVCSYAGNLYAVGGWLGVDRQTNVFRFNGTTWSQVAGLPAAEVFPATAVLDDRLYVIGGSRASGTGVTNVYRFDGTTWTEVAGHPRAHYGASAAALGGALYTAGGIASGNPITNVYRYNGTAWTEVAGLPVPCAFLILQNVGSYLYVAGGSDAGFSAMTNAYRFDGATWTKIAGLPASRRLHAAAVLDGSLYSMGGTSGGARSNVYYYHPSAITADDE